MGIILNEWVWLKLFDADGYLSRSNKILMRIFNILSIIGGIYFISFRNNSFEKNELRIKKVLKDGNIFENNPKKTILLFILSRVYKWTNWKEKLFGTVSPPPQDDYKIIE